MRPTHDELRDRRRQALVLRSEGLTLREIGQRIGQLSDPDKPLSVERSRQMIWRTVREVISAGDQSDPLWAIAERARDERSPYKARPFEPKPRDQFACSECRGTGILSDGYNSVICPTCGGSRYWDIPITHIEA
jgi:hypothetical protein